MNCMGCRLANHFIETNVVYEDDFITCILDIAPLNEGHTLILPKRHYEELGDLDESTMKSIMTASSLISKVLNSIYSPDGITVIQNGGIFNDLGHYHMHVFPRYKDDGFEWVEPNNKSNTSLDQVKGNMIDELKLLHDIVDNSFSIRRLEPDQKIPYDLLLLADPSRKLIDDYIHRGICYLAYNYDEIVGEVVLIPTHLNTYEIVNVAVKEDYQGRGIGRTLIERAISEAKNLKASSIEIGTGNSSFHQLKLYQKCGFRITGIDHCFFTRNYSEDIFEDGIQCIDMIRLSIEF